jgi:maltose O-acetyltransferase
MRLGRGGVAGGGVVRCASSRSWTVRVNVVAASPLITVERRRSLYRHAGIIVGQRADLRPHVWIFSERLSVGDDTLVGWGCHFENREPIYIGARCSIASQVSIATSTHEIGEHDHRAGAYAGLPVRIGDGCWIGTNVVILPGVDVGAGCVIGAGALVTRDCEPDGTYIGVPARRVSDLA